MTRERKTKQARAPVRVGQRKLAPSGRQRGGVTGPAMLQRRLGNRGTQAWMNVQTKLTVGQPGDRYEREADYVAERVARGRSSPTISHLVTGDTEGGVVALQPVVEASTVAPTLDDEIRMETGGGQRLPTQVRKTMEQTFDSDFSHTRIHTDAKSDKLNKSLNARAFTTGQDIFFRSGSYNPASREGQKLLAHELTHVLQQLQSGLHLQLIQLTPTEDFRTVLRLADERQMETIELNSRLRAIVRNLRLSDLQGARRLHEALTSDSQLAGALRARLTTLYQDLVEALEQRIRELVDEQQAIFSRMRAGARGAQGPPFPSRSREATLKPLPIEPQQSTTRRALPQIRRDLPRMEYSQSQCLYACERCRQWPLSPYCDICLHDPACNIFGGPH